MLKMISHINEVQINSVVIDEPTQVGTILETVPNFLQFKSNYFMNKLLYDMTQLLNKLTTYEFILDGKQGETNVVEAQTSTNKKMKKQNEGNAKFQHEREEKKKPK